MAIQGRKFCGILYVESETYIVDEVLERLKAYFDQWAKIERILNYESELGMERQDGYLHL